MTFAQERLERLCAELVEKGRRRPQEIEIQRDIAEADLLARLVRFEKRSRCWGRGQMNELFS